MERATLLSPLRIGLRLLLLLVLTIAAGTGIVYFAWQGSLIGVVLSAVIPGLCAMSVLGTGAERPKTMQD